jgi:hypothetical protein
MANPRYRVKQAVQAGTTALALLRGTPDYKKIPDLRALERSLPRVRFRSPAETIGGWMNSDEQRALYALGRFSVGPIMEIGPWLGLSTCCIAQGIRDSGSFKKFVTCELAPTLKNFRAVDAESVGFFYPEDSELPMGVCSLELFERDIKPVLGHPQGLLGQLKSNLARMDVDELVEVFVGDFRNSADETYGFLFTDSMHDENEINRNAPDLKRFIGPGSILACHDSNETNERCLSQYIEFSYSFTVGSLFVGEVAAD